MKIRIKSGDCPSYLTVGKVYEVVNISSSDDFCTIIDDLDIAKFLCLDDCAHLKGGSWEIVND